MYNLANIRKLADAKKLKLKDVFEYAGITDMGLRKSIENQNMSLKTLDKLADLFEISMSELIDDSRHVKVKVNTTTAVDIDVYRKLIATQEELIRKQEKLYYSLEREKQALVKQVEKLTAELNSRKKEYPIGNEPIMKVAESPPTSHKQK